MILTYENKKSEKEILDGAKKAVLKSVSGKGSANKLIQGDNLAILKTLLEDGKLGGKVDLIYIDPPFMGSAMNYINSRMACFINVPR